MMSQIIFPGRNHQYEQGLFYTLQTQSGQFLSCPDCYVTQEWETPLFLESEVRIACLLEKRPCPETVSFATSRYINCAWIVYSPTHLQVLWDLLKQYPCPEKFQLTQVFQGYIERDVRYGCLRFKQGNTLSQQEFQAKVTQTLAFAGSPSIQRDDWSQAPKLFKTMTSLPKVQDIQSQTNVDCNKKPQTDIDCSKKPQTRFHFWKTRRLPQIEAPEKEETTLHIHLKEYDNFDRQPCNVSRIMPISVIRIPKAYFKKGGETYYG